MVGWGGEVKASIGHVGVVALAGDRKREGGGREADTTHRIYSPLELESRWRLEAL